MKIDIDFIFDPGLDPDYSALTNKITQTKAGCLAWLVVV